MLASRQCGGWIKNRASTLGGSPSEAHAQTLSNRLGKIGIDLNNRLFCGWRASFVLPVLLSAGDVVRPDRGRHAIGRDVGAVVPMPARSMPLVSFRKLTATVEMTAATAR